MLQLETGTNRVADTINGSINTAQLTRNRLSLQISYCYQGICHRSASLVGKHRRMNSSRALSRPKKQVHATLSGLDKTLIVALASLAALYTVITLIVFNRVSDTNFVEDATFSNRPTETSVTVNGASATAHDNVPKNNRMILPLQKQLPPSRTDRIELIQHMFPIHVGGDVEEIAHPGVRQVSDPNKIPDSLPRTMTVPKFFDQSHGHYYFSATDEAKVAQNATTIRHYLGDGATLLTPEQASTIGSFTTIHGVPMETIYCSVASYRDPECTGSVEDLYARAEFPDRIRVAILDQRVNGDPVCSQPAKPCSDDPYQALCQYKHLIDVYEMDAVLAVGPVFARHLAHRLYRGEYFAMQIDSHVRFVEHWDSDIVGQWKSAKNEMGVLSTYLSDIIGSIEPETHKGIHKGRPIMCQSDYEGNGDNKHLRHGQQPEGEAGIKGQPTLHPFWAAGFSFARGHFVIQVPYDQHLPMVFQGEEISIGLRGFTYGYDYYAAERSTCFHMYAIKGKQMLLSVQGFDSLVCKSRAFAHWSLVHATTRERGKTEKGPTLLGAQ
jgi:[Skp1-protein]-hydroxyproline N-acetylglucosaminyltransferase